MTVGYADMESKLLTLDSAKEILAKTEPLISVPVSKDVSTKWRFEPEWAFTLDTTHGTQPVAATIDVDGTEYRLTKDAVLTAASAFGLPGSHAKQLPAHLMEQEMNYWFGAGIGKKDFSLLISGKDQYAAAFVKSTKTPFSNLRILDALEAQIVKRYGHTKISVDYKMSHSLTKTDIRLILPDIIRQTIQSQTPDDQWSAGIHLSNSLTAAHQTSIDPYLFRWVCTNGATSQQSLGGTWNRRSDGQREENVLTWAQREVDAIFENLPAKWSELQKLTQVNIEGNAEAIMRDVFKVYGVPYTQQNEIISQLGENPGDITMYDLMQTITELANNPTLKPERADSLMRIGGSIPTALFDPLNRKLWDEGHAASADAANPYAV